MSTILRSRGFMNAFWLKIIMLVLMLADHLYYYIFPRELVFAHYLARVVAPVFTFLMAQSMVYTRDRLRYIFRLFVFAAIMSAGNYILLAITGTEVPNNIFFSLALGAALIYFIDKFLTGSASSKFFYLLIIIVCVLASFYCEGQYLVPLMAVIFYYLRGNRALMYVSYIILTVLPFFIAYLETGYMQAQFYMITAVFPIMLYNGERGPDNMFAKYIFYIFYPVHVWVLFILSELL